MKQFVRTPFRINFFKSLFWVWRLKISVRYWCRECGVREEIKLPYGSIYPDVTCAACGAKNILNIKYG